MDSGDAHYMVMMRGGGSLILPAYITLLILLHIVTALVLVLVVHRQRI